MSKHFRPPILVLLVALVVGCWGAAATAQDEVKASAKPAPAAAAPQPIKVGEAMKVQPNQAIVKPPLSAEEKALVAILDDGRKQVIDMTRAMEAMPDGQAKLDLEKKIVQMKQDTWVRLLQAKVSFARSRGDLKAAQDIQGAIDNILHPRPVVSTATVSRPAPDKSTH